MIIEVNYQDTNKKEQHQVTANPCIVGRSSKADVCISREGLSRNHFQVEIRGEELYITDLNSTNGVMVNGEKIPPGVATHYKGIFPLEIGASISVTVSLDDMQPQEPVLQRPSRSESSSPSVAKVGEQTKTKTKTLVMDQARPKANSNPKAERNDQKNLLIMAGLVIAAGIFGFYFYSQDESQPTVTETASASGRPTGSNYQEEAKIPPFDVNAFDFKEHINSSKCPELGAACAGIGLTMPKEGLTIVDNKMIVYVNIENVPKEGLSPKFLAMSEKERAEMALARVGTHPLLHKELKKHKPSHLLVVGFTSIEDLVRVKHVINFSYTQLPPMDEDLHAYVFSEIFFNGVTMPYRNYIGYYGQLSDL